MKRRMQYLAVAAFLSGVGAEAWGNHLQITNVTVIGRDESTAHIQFDITWENSWRYAAGEDPLYLHDAAWVFFKVLPDGRTDWEHVMLEGSGTNPTDYVIGTGTGIELVVPEDRAGMFVRRSGEGSGVLAVESIKAVWNFASNSLTKADTVNVRAFGVEMVYVAEGAFWAGNTNGVIESSFRDQNNENAPMWIDSTNAFTIYWGAGPTSASVPAAFPNGYAPFYCMKYETTQGQYADFLNTLTRQQQEARCVATTLNYYMSDTAGGSASISMRNTVRLTTDAGSPSSRVYTTETPDRVCNWMSWADLTAFADWAGLRPMTELEFEKVCRGPLDAVNGECAWGDATSIAIMSLQGTDGSGQEYYTSGNAHITGNGGPSGPVRTGIFAKSGTTRSEAGSSYWGIMELSGNVWERPVSVGHATGLLFTGGHGDGALTEVGDANVDDWPGSDGSGAGRRGGSGWTFSGDYARVSDRKDAAKIHEIRFSYYGGRGVRSASSVGAP